MPVPTEATLIELADTDMTVTDPQDDVRGRKVVDVDGEELGKVDDLLIDENEQKVRLLRVKHGGFLGIGADHFLVPVDAVTSVTEEQVRIDRERGRMSDVPGYDPEIRRNPDYYGDIYDWWGYPSYWGPDYQVPGNPPYGPGAHRR